MTGRIRLVPTTGGHLLPVPIEGELPHRWVEDGITYEEVIGVRDPLTTLGEQTCDTPYSPKLGNSYSSDISSILSRSEPQEQSEEIMLDDYSHQLASVLARRSELLDDAKTITRDDLIEAMVLHGRDICGDRVQRTVRPADERIIEIVDRLDHETGLASAQDRKDLAMLKKIDRARFRIPAHFRTVLDLLYYQGMSMKAVSDRMGYSTEKTAHTARQALQALSEVVR